MVIAQSIVGNVVFGFMFGVGFGVATWLLGKILK